MKTTYSLLNTLVLAGLIDVNDYYVITIYNTEIKLQGTKEQLVLDKFNKLIQNIEKSLKHQDTTIFTGIEQAETIDTDNFTSIRFKVLYAGLWCAIEYIYNK